MRFLPGIRNLATRVAPHGRGSPASAPAVAFVTLILLPGCATSRLDKVTQFRAAEKRGDYATAQAYLSPDPRVWYEERKGPGEPLKLGAGRWKHWDEQFNSQTTAESWSVTGDTVSAVFNETNDFYRLTERGPSRYRMTWFFGQDDKIAGQMVSAVPSDKPSTSRQKEFEAWARQQHPDELEYLMPNGKIDPTGGRAERLRRLLVEWRAAVGLPPI